MGTRRDAQPVAVSYCSYKRCSETCVSLPRLLIIDFWQSSKLKCFQSHSFHERVNTLAQSPGRSEGCVTGCHLLPTMLTKETSSPPPPWAAQGVLRRPGHNRDQSLHEVQKMESGLDHPDDGRTGAPGRAQGGHWPSWPRGGNPVMPRALCSWEAQDSLAKRERQSSSWWMTNQFFRRMLEEIASWNLSLHFPLWVMWRAFTLTGSSRKHSSKGSLPKQGHFPQAACSFLKNVLDRELDNKLYFTLCLYFLEIYSQILSSGKNTRSHIVHSVLIWPLTQQYFFSICCTFPPVTSLLKIPYVFLCLLKMSLGNKRPEWERERDMGTWEEQPIQKKAALDDVHPQTQKCFERWAKNFSCWTLSLPCTAARGNQEHSQGGETGLLTLTAKEDRRKFRVSQEEG